MSIEKPNEYGPVSEDELKEFELRIGAMLPDQYRRFLLEHNGGKPVPSDFHLPGNNVSGLHHVYGLHQGPDYRDIQSAYKVFKGRVPKEMLAIAEDGFGNQICIGLKKKHVGKVYFWDHEECGLFFKSHETILLASTFDGFIDNLFEYIDPNETEVDRIVRVRDLNALTLLLENGYDIEQENDYGWTLIEKASISANAEFISYLYEAGAELKESISLAERNAEFFEEYKPIVELLRNLKRK